MRFDFALAVNLAQLANSVAGGRHKIQDSSSTSQFRTANYITHGLPQQCLPSPHTSTATDIAALPDASMTVGRPVDSLGNVVVTVTEVREVVAAAKNTQLHTTIEYPSRPVESIVNLPLSVEDNDSNDSPLDNANFLSFDEWRKQNLAKAGQSSEDFGERAPREPRKRPGSGSINDLDSLGEDAEIELNFGFGDYDAPDGAQQKPVGKPSEQPPPLWQQRSKMAGKTGKERFNYASFDCAATVHKTNREVKGSSAILVENKDSYMLNECRAENKFVIVELCDDILVDTVVLANYEFFSSMFKTFRVSVSDRYPVKASGWKELGLFEGKNSREIQAFLVENPQIWARYLKIDFLTHYGNEFYCPISLLRVHGTTMLEEFRAQEEAARGVVTEDFAEDEVVEDAKVNVKKDIDQVYIEALDIPTGSEVAQLSQMDDTIPPPPPESILDVWDLAVVNVYKPALVTGLPPPQPTKMAQCSFTEKGASILVPGVCSAVYTPSPTIRSSFRTETENFKTETSYEILTTPTTPPGQETTVAGRSPQHSSGHSHSEVSYSPSVRKVDPQHHSSSEQPPRQYSSPISSPPQASPTQESFFKQIHKRIQLLEANVTLSLQYIEDQSRTLRDAMAKVEKRQAQKQATFMEALNSTMQVQLSEYRQQYDQLWQSTVIALENQRRQSESEILAVSSRLALLADEVIYQKRMSYVQSLLLLVCIVLVLFSRSSHFDAPTFHSFRDRTNTSIRIFESPPTSPQALKISSPKEADLEYVEDGDFRIRGGRMRRLKGGIFSSFTRRSKAAREDSMESIDGNSGDSLRSPTFPTSPLSPGFEPSRERARSPPSPRPPSPISRSSPATPTGTRGRDSDGGEDGWRVFGPNLRVVELKAAHVKQSFQRLPSPLGIYTGPEDEKVVEQQEETDVGSRGGVYDGVDEEDCEEREVHHRRRKSESAVQGDGRRVGAGGLPSPSVSPPGSPRPKTAQSNTQSQSQVSSPSQAKGHSRTGSRHHKKKKGKK